MKYRISILLIILFPTEVLCASYIDLYFDKQYAILEYKGHPRNIKDEYKNIKEGNIKDTQLLRTGSKRLGDFFNFAQ